MNPDGHRAADNALARGRLSEAIALLERALGDAPNDFEGWLKLAALRRGAGQISAALDAANAALGVRPNEFMALLLKGTLHEQLGERGRAAELYRAVLFHAASAEALPAPLSAQLDRIRAFLTEYRAEVEARLTTTGTLDERHKLRARRFADNVLDRRPVHRQEPTHYRYPGLADIEYFDDAYEAFRERLRQAAPKIVEEYRSLAEAHAERQRPYVDFAPGQPVGQWGPLNRSHRWNALHLIRYGERDPVNAAACPETMAAFEGEAQPSIPGLGPNLMFSMLAPHTHIPAHHGVANFRVVCHVPLIVPEGCRFRVGADVREWQEGEPWIFDDTIEHEAWNDSDELRVVLIGDLWRPELDDDDRLVVRDLMAAMAISGSLGDL